MSKTILLHRTRRRVVFLEHLRHAAHDIGINSIFSADEDNIDPVAWLSDRHFVVNPVKSPAFTEQMSEIINSNNIGIMIPWIDSDIREFALNMQSFFRDNQLLCLIPPKEYVDLMTDKALFARWASGQSLPHAETWVDKDDVKYPAVIKWRYGQGTRDFAVVHSRQDLFSHKTSRDVEVVYQKLLYGTEYTVDVLLDERYEPLFIVPRKRVKVRSGEVLVSKISMDDAIIDFVRDVIRPFRFTGMFNVQVFCSDNGIFLIEMNPRFGGGSDLTIEAGVDFPRYMLELAEYGRIRSNAPRIQDGLTMSRYLAPVFF